MASGLGNSDPALDVSGAVANGLFPFSVEVLGVETCRNNGDELRITVVYG